MLLNANTMKHLHHPHYTFKNHIHLYTHGQHTHSDHQAWRYQHVSLAKMLHQTTGALTSHHSFSTNVNLEMKPLAFASSARFQIATFKIRWLYK